MRAASASSSALARKVAKALRVVSGLGAGIGMAILGGLVFGLILHVFLKLSEGQATTKQTLGMVYWAGLIGYGLKTILSWIVLVVTQNVQLSALSVTSLMPDGNPQSLAFVLAGWFGDPFVWWMLAVLSIGAVIVHRLPMVRGATVVVATYTLLGAVMAAFTLIGSALSG